MVTAVKDGSKSSLKDGENEICGFFVTWLLTEAHLDKTAFQGIFKTCVSCLCPDVHPNFMKIQRNFYGIVLGFCLLTLSAKAFGEATVAGSKQLQKMKKLAGKWIGPDPRRKRDNIIVEYQVISQGQAVLEKTFSGTPEEMVSIYFDGEDGRLQVEHFGMYPHPSPLELRVETDAVFTFLLPVGSGIQPGAPHLHELIITFPDEDHIVQHWTTYEEQNPRNTMIFGLARLYPSARTRTGQEIEARKDREEEEAQKAALKAAEMEKARRLEAKDAARRAEEVGKARQAAEARRLDETEKTRKAQGIPKTAEPRKYEPVKAKKEKVSQVEEMAVADNNKDKSPESGTVLKGFKKMLGMIIGE